MTRVLIAVDLEADAPHEVLQGARPWIEAMGYPADLLFADRFAAFALAGLDGSLRRQAQEEIRERDERHRAVLRSLLETLPEALRGECLVAHGYPAPAICDQAEQHTLVVVGAATVGLRRTLLGSVSEPVIRKCPVPVLVVHEPAALAGRPRLLGALELADHQAALAEMISWAQATDGVLDLVMVQERAVRDPAVRELVREQYDKARALERARFEALAAEIPLRHRGLAAVEVGSPADRITSSGEDHDLILVATHGRTGLSRVFLGSVAETVARTSPVAVLVLRL